MPTLTDIDGYAHQTVQTAQAGSGFIGTYDAVVTPSAFTFDTVNKRLSSHVASMKLIETGAAACHAGRTIAAGNRHIVGSFYFRITTAPATASSLFYTTGPASSATFAMDTSGHIQGLLSATTVTTSGTYADSNWHRIDFNFDCSGSTFTIDWRVDGVAQTQVSRGSQTAADLTGWSIGSLTSAHNLTCWYQDTVISLTAADYPIGPHVVLPLYPTGEGTETLGSSNKIQDEAAGQTNLYQHVDDWNGGLPNTTDYVTYASTTLGDAASNFAEFTMSDPAANYTTVWDVEGYIAGFAANTTANNADTQVLTAHGGTLIDHIGNLIDYSGSTTVLGYYRQFLARPSGGWTNANLAAAVVQWGRSTDTNPQPRLSAVMLEFAASITDTPITHGVDAIIQSTLTKTHSVDAIVKKTLTVAHQADAIIKKTATVSHSADAIVKRIGTLTHGADAIIDSGIHLVTHDVDAIIKKTTTVAHSADAIVKKTSTPTHSVDAIIQSTLTKTHSADAILKKTSTVEHLADAIVKRTAAVVHAADAIVKKTLTVAHQADAIIKKTFALTHSADAIVVMRATKVHAADAIIKRTATLAHGADAIIARTTILTHGADAIIEKTSTLQHAADAIIKSTLTKVHAADAIIEKTSTLVHATDAIVLRTSTLAHGADALLFKHAARPYSSEGADSTAGSASASDSTADTATGSDFTGDTIVEYKRLTVAHSTDAIIV